MYSQTWKSQGEMRCVTYVSIPWCWRRKCRHSWGGPFWELSQWFLFIQCTQVEHCISQGCPGKQTTGDIIYMYVKSLQTRRERDWRNWPMQLWGLLNLKFVWQASSLEIWMRLDVTVLGPKIGNLEFLCCSLETEFLLLLETSVFALQVINRLAEAHPHYGSWSVLKVHWL